MTGQVNKINFRSMKNLTLILLLTTLFACGGQRNKTVELERKISASDSKNSNNTSAADIGIVYFSNDNGSTWTNGSKGLPEKITIGLGGTAVSPALIGVATKENGVYLFDFKDSLWVSIPASQQMIKNNIGAMTFYKSDIWVGTQHGEVYLSNDKGKSWTVKNSGLKDLTIRRFAEIDGKLYVATNSGLYSYDDASGKWELEYGQISLQVNGITESEGSIYIATNQGVFKSEMKAKNWVKVFPDRSVHNISSVGTTIYAMVYNELFSSTDKGESWHSIQNGLPKDLYTFNVIESDNTVFAGQWDGIYSRRNSTESWKFSGKGLPANFAATNLKSRNGLLIITTSARKLKSGMTI
jgi:hypothetical protein